MQNVFDKNYLQDTEVSTKFISSSTATACSSKIIDNEMDPPALLSVIVTISPPISGYRLTDMSISADVFMLLCCPGCQGMLCQCLKLCDINDKKKGLARYLHLSFTVGLYSHTFFTSKQIDQRNKNKGRLNLYGVNVGAIY